MALSTFNKRIAAGLIVAGFLGAMLWQVRREDYGVGVDGVRWLPAEARNISYIRNGRQAAAEFDIGREDFEKWCAGRKMPLRKLGADEGCDVPRCLWLLQEKGIIAVVPEPNGAYPQDLSLWSEKREFKSLGEGDLYYEDRWANGGGYTLGYDINEKRGYYHYRRH